MKATQPDFAFAGTSITTDVADQETTFATVLPMTTTTSGGYVAGNNPESVT